MKAKSSSENSYESHIKRLLSMYKNTEKICKSKSDDIVKHECPYCDMYDICIKYHDDISENHVYHMCLKRSSQTLRTWLDIENNDRAKVELGKKYGKLTVMKKAPVMGKNPKWECKCDCGNVAIIRGSHLLSGNTISCGCELGNNQYKSGLGGLHIS